MWLKQIFRCAPLRPRDGASRIVPVNSGNPQEFEKSKGEDPEVKTMTSRFMTLVPSTKNILRLALLSGLAASAPLLATGQAKHDHDSPARLVQIVRDATRQFIDVNNAAPDYGPAFGCVSGPDHGAMGIHYINGTLVGDGEIDAAHPEALIYEPAGARRTRAGVEK